MPMKRKSLFIAALLAVGVCASTSTFAQSLLDQQLDDKPAAPTPPGELKPSPPLPNSLPGAVPDEINRISPSTTQPAATATPTPAPGGADMVSPDAAKKVDDNELINKLTNPDQGKPEAKKTAEQIKSMLDHMHESAQLLNKSDPGDVTQETQRRIVLDLDALIQLAQQQQQGGGSSKGPPQQGQQRQPSQAQGDAMGQGGNTPAANEHPETGGTPDVAAGEMRNHDPATWGQLPPVDRDAISHGANEEYLSAYRDLIDRYYQSLAELAKSGSGH